MDLLGPKSLPCLVIVFLEVSVALTWAHKNLLFCRVRKSSILGFTLRTDNLVGFSRPSRNQENPQRLFRRRCVGSGALARS